MQKVMPCLSFDDNAEEAVQFYTSIFKNSKIITTTRYGEAGAEAAGRPQGSVMTILFQIEGQEFLALNGGPVTFSPAISFIVNCETQEELDTLWEKLSAGGEEVQCGWLKDKYGVSWQIDPAILLGEMLQDKDAERANRVMQAMLQMVKLDIAELKRAYEQK